MSGGESAQSREAVMPSGGQLSALLTPVGGVESGGVRGTTVKPIDSRIKAALLRKLKRGGVEPAEVTAARSRSSEVKCETSLPGTAAKRLRVHSEDLAVPPRDPRCQHLPDRQEMQGNLLEDVLNEKKMLLMQSPEIVACLRRVQADICARRRQECTAHVSACRNL